MYKDSTNGTQLYSGTTTGTSITFTPTASILYESIPSNSNAKCVYSVIYGSTSTKTTTGNYTYKIKGTEKPIFTDFAYEDTNSVVTNLTGNNQILVKGYSNVKAVISTANKATAQSSSTMSNYIMTIGNTSTSPVSYSSTEEVTLSISKVASGEIKVSANDSRGLSTIVSKIATFKDYSKPAIAKMSVERSDNGVGENVTLAFEGSWWNDNFGNTQNSIKKIKYSYKRTNSTGDFIEGTTEITFTINEGKFSGSLVIEGDTSSKGYDVSSSYFIKLLVTDQLDTSEEYQLTLGSGEPAIAIYDNKVAIGQKYDTDEGSKLQVNGNVQVKGNLDFSNNNNATILWKENGYGDKFQIKPSFSGSGNSNYLGFYSSTGDAGTSPDVSLKSKIDASGNITATKFIGPLEGNASSSSYSSRVASRGVVAPEGGGTGISVAGISMTQAYNNSYPNSYGNILNLRGAGCSELFLGWQGNSTPRTIIL